MPTKTLKKPVVMKKQDKTSNFVKAYGTAKKPATKRTEELRKAIAVTEKLHVDHRAKRIEEEMVERRKAFSKNKDNSFAHLAGAIVVGPGKIENPRVPVNYTPLEFLRSVVNVGKVTMWERDRLYAYKFKDTYNVGRFTATSTVDALKQTVSLHVGFNSHNRPVFVTVPLAAVGEAVL